MRSRPLALALTLAALAIVPTARAQDPSPGGDLEEPPAGADEARGRARTLANDGLRAFRRGDYVEALANFEKAEAIVPAPTIALHRARSLEKLGRLAEALERFKAIVSAPVVPDAPYVHHRARQDAQLELNALEPRVPTLTIIVEGTPGSKAELTIDGRRVELEGKPSLDKRVDPGQHTVEIRRRDGTRATGTITLTQGSTRELRLALPPPRAAGAGADEADDEESAPVGPGDPRVTWDGADQRAAGWVAISAAGVGLGIALITGAAAIVQGSDLDERCPEGVCPADAAADVADHDAYRAASTVGWIFAGTFGAAGTILLLTAPDDAPSAGGAAAGPKATATVSPRGVSLRVTY